MQPRSYILTLACDSFLRLFAKKPHGRLLRPCECSLSSSPVDRRIQSLSKMRNSASSRRPLAKSSFVSSPHFAFLDHLGMDRLPFELLTLIVCELPQLSQASPCAHSTLPSDFIGTETSLPTRRSALASLSRTNKTFHNIVTRKLYLHVVLTSENRVGQWGNFYASKLNPWNLQDAKDELKDLVVPSSVSTSGFVGNNRELSLIRLLSFRRSPSFPRKTTRSTFRLSRSSLANALPSTLFSPSQLHSLHSSSETSRLSSSLQVSPSTWSLSQLSTLRLSLPEPSSSIST